MKSKEEMQLLTSLVQGRKDLGLTQADAGEKLGVKQTQISRVERGMVSPTLATVVKMADLYNLEVQLVPKKGTGANAN